jgi:hypothetical protein
MDKEQAKFILQSFRPDGADASDADFAEALQLAAEDRELGEWLAKERATDAAFAAALCELEIPEDLRQHILAVIRGESPEDLLSDQDMDAVLFNAMDELQPPEGLRDQILAAMDVQQAQDDRKASAEDPASNVVTGRFGNWPRVAAIAAALVLGAFVAIQVTPGDKPSDGLFESHEVQRYAGGLIDASISMDVDVADSTQLHDWMVSKNIPTPSTIPLRLLATNTIGCKEISLPVNQENPEERKAWIFSFAQQGGEDLYLVIVKNIYVRDRNLSAMSEVTTKDCYHCPETRWNVARWQDARNTYMLLVKKEAARKNELLSYF